MTAPVSPTANVAFRVLDALGYGADPAGARQVLAWWARPVTRLSVAEVVEVLATVDRAAAAAVPGQRPGDVQYYREPEPGTEGTGRPWAGPRCGDVVDDQGTVE